MYVPLEAGRVGKVEGGTITCVKIKSVVEITAFFFFVTKEIFFFLKHAAQLRCFLSISVLCSKQNKKNPKKKKKKKKKERTRVVFWKRDLLPCFLSVRRLLSAKKKKCGGFPFYVLLLGD